MKVDPEFQAILQQTAKSVSKLMAQQGFDVTTLTGQRVEPTPGSLFTGDLTVQVVGSRDSYTSPVVLTKPPSEYNANPEKMEQFWALCAKAFIARIERDRLYPTPQERFMERITTYSALLCRLLKESDNAREVDYSAGQFKAVGQDFNISVTFKVIRPNGQERTFRLDMDTTYVRDALVDDHLLETLGVEVLKSIVWTWHQQEAAN